MSNPYYLGSTPDQVLGNSPRYLYALRRNEDGELFLLRSDQLIDKSSIEINTSGAPGENFIDFEAGIDFFDGITEDHETEYDNLVYTQYRWDDRNMLYYVGTADGRLTQRINQGYTYPTGTSS